MLETKNHYLELFKISGLFDTRSYHSSLKSGRRSPGNLTQTIIIHLQGIKQVYIGGKKEAADRKAVHQGLTNILILFYQFLK